MLESGKKEWVLHETHIVGHMKLEITEAEVKQEKDWAKKPSCDGYSCVFLGAIRKKDEER
jgi:hypothetical protein